LELLLLGSISSMRSVALINFGSETGFTFTKNVSNAPSPHIVDKGRA